MKKTAENEDISIDIDTGEEIELEQEEVTNSALKTKIKKLREELAEVKKERDENLAGWQRSKADLINFRKKSEKDVKNRVVRAKAEVVREIIPGLDAFDAAMNDRSWVDVDKKWREGMERIVTQLHTALNSEGLKSFGEVGDDFNPEEHECMSVEDAGNKRDDNRIKQVLQKGYRIKDELVRPAKVIIYQFKNED